MVSKAVTALHFLTICAHQVGASQKQQHTLSLPAESAGKNMKGAQMVLARIERKLTTGC